MLKVNQVCIYKYISEQQQFGTKQVRAGSYCWSYCRNSVQFKYVLALWLCSLIFIEKPIHLVGIYNESEATELESRQESPLRDTITFNGCRQCRDRLLSRAVKQSAPRVVNQMYSQMLYLTKVSSIQ